MSKRIKISDIAYDEHNFNKHTIPGMELLKKSIETVGIIESVTVSSDDKIISGNARHEKILDVFGNDIEPIVVESDGKRPIVLKRTDIQSGTKAFHEAAILANTTTKLNINLDLDLIQEIAVQEFDIDIVELGVDIIDLDDENKKIDEDDYQIPDDIKTDIRLGDLFEITYNGITHRLLCGDSTKIEDVRLLMNDRLSDMIFTDPPYNVKIKDIVNSGNVKHAEFIMGSGTMNENEFIDFLSKSFKNLVAFSKNGSIHYICMDWKHIYEISIAGRENYTELKNLCVWNKDNGGLGTFYRSKHELIFVYKNGDAKHTNNFGLGETGRYRTNVWDYAGVNSFTNHSVIVTDEGKKVSGGSNDLKMHPTVKPIKLVSDAILDCSIKGELILDLFGGSGTTLMASANTGRICYMMELDPKYCQVIINRFTNSFHNVDIKYIESNNFDAN